MRSFKASTAAHVSSSCLAFPASRASSRRSFSAAVPVQPRRVAREKPYCFKTSPTASSALLWYTSTTYCSSVSRPPRRSWASSVAFCSSPSSLVRSDVPATVPNTTFTSWVEVVSRGMSRSIQGARAIFWALSLFCSA